MYKPRDKHAHTQVEFMFPDFVLKVLGQINFFKLLEKDMYQRPQ